MIKISKIGIEFEFSITPPKTFKDIKDGVLQITSSFNSNNSSNIIVDIDKEYYESQIEVKMRMDDLSVEKIHGFKSLLDKIYNECGIVSCVGEPYVGTHIHLFLERDGLPITSPLRGKLLKVFRFVYAYMFSYLSTSNVKDSILYTEAMRLARNHNILRYFDYRFLNDGIRKNLNSRGLSYPLFDGGCNKQKYSPVYFSPATTNGKPFSLEIRAIPNSWFLSSSEEEIVDFLYSIEGILNSKGGGVGAVRDILDTHIDILNLIT